MREIPQQYEFSCDGCGIKELKKFNQRPAHWSDLIIRRDAYDWQGNACADGSVSRLLCQKCSQTVADAINASLAETKV